LVKNDVLAAETEIGTITGVQIGSSVTSIGVFGDPDSAPFYQKTALTSLTFKTGSTCSLIGNASFFGCTGLESLAFPDSLITIYGSAFSECTGLESLTFGNSLEYIYINAFRNCTLLTTLTFPDSLISIDYLAFYESRGLDTVIFAGSGILRTISVNQAAFQKPDTLNTAISGGSLDIESGGNTYTQVP
jgi:hypothetical protein